MWSFERRRTPLLAACFDVSLILRYVENCEVRLKEIFDFSFCTLALALLGRAPPPLVTGTNSENGHSKNDDSENGHKAEKNGKEAGSSNEETKPTETTVAEETPKVVKETKEETLEPHIYENVFAGKFAWNFCQKISKC